VWRYVYRAVDDHGQVIDVLVSARRDLAAARRFFVRRLAVQEDPEQVTTDRAPDLAAAIAELLPAAVHDTEQYANNRMECDHGRLKARLRPMRGLKIFRSARTIIAGQSLIQNLRRGHYELGLEAPHSRLRVAAAFDELARTI
jgi:transposase, IS6 family